MVRLTDCPDMTLDVYRGCKTTMQQSICSKLKNYYFHVSQYLSTLRCVYAQLNIDECISAHYVKFDYSKSIFAKKLYVCVYHGVITAVPVLFAYCDIP